MAMVRRTERIVRRGAKYQRRQTAPEFAPSLPKGVNAVVVDVVGRHVLERDRELLKKLEAYDREERKSD